MKHNFQVPKWFLNTPLILHMPNFFLTDPLVLSLKLSVVGGFHFSWMVVKIFPLLLPLSVRIWYSMAWWMVDSISMGLLLVLKYSSFLFSQMFQRLNGIIVSQSIQLLYFLPLRAFQVLRQLILVILVESKLWIVVLLGAREFQKMRLFCKRRRCGRYLSHICCTGAREEIFKPIL